MDELACFRDWDLEAIVRGSCSGTNPEFSYFLTQQDELLDSFPEFSETTRVLDDLEELYKPFYPLLHPLSPQTIVTTSSLPIIPIQPQPSPSSSSQGFKVPAPPKTKKSKKKQNKSVVKEVTTAEGVDDAWAWRKYGQKPIKGSAYPRSYYRCSSSKGCLARKQVERSQLDPSVFVVTYTAEHSHPKPTRRNSLAGTTRKNNSLLPPPSTTHQMQLQTIQVQQSFDFKKDQDFIQWLDDDTAQFGDSWIPSSDLDKAIGLECQHFPLDAGFTDDFPHP